MLQNHFFCTRICILHVLYVAKTPLLLYEYLRPKCCKDPSSVCVSCLNVAISPLLCAYLYLKCCKGTSLANLCPKCCKGNSSAYLCPTFCQDTSSVRVSVSYMLQSQLFCTSIRVLNVAKTPLLCAYLCPKCCKGPSSVRVSVL